MQNRIRATLAALLFLTIPAVSQVPSTMPPNTVLCRLGISPGPPQACSFASVLGAANVQPKSNNLTALLALSGVGFPTRTGTDTWAQRAITGVTNRTTITNGNGVSGNPTVDIASTYVGQSSITTLGTITSGVWNGTTIALANGGCGATSAADCRTSLGLGSMATQGSSAVAITGGTITGMANPTLGSDVANKTYVDLFGSGLHVGTAAKWATTGVLPNTPTYDNGTLGVGATLTAGGNAAIAVDSGSPASSDRVLVKNQASAFQNGVYTVTTVGDGSTPWVLTRATDFDTAAEMLGGTTFLVTAGTANIGTGWALQATIVTVGTTAATFGNYTSLAGSLIAANNLSDVASASSARSNLGLVIGTNVQAFDSDLAALAANSTSGLWTRTGSGTGAARTITGTANEITIANGTGVSGDPTVSLPSAMTMTGKTVTGGTFNSTFNGTIGATTPSTVAGTTGTFSGDFGIGGSNPISSAGGERYFLVSGAGIGPNKYGIIGAGGNITGTSDFVGSFSFVNTAIGAAEKRVASVSGSTDGATNSGSLQLNTWNAGVVTSYLTIDHLGATTLFGTLKFPGIPSVATPGCLANDASGNISGGQACSGTGFPSGGVRGDLPFYTASGTGAATKASDANVAAAGGDASGTTAVTSGAPSPITLAASYSNRVVLPPAPGGTTGAYKFSADFTFASGTELIIPCGVTLVPDSGKVVRNNGVTKGGQCVIAAGSGTVYLGRDVRADWWPSTGGDDSLAINAADASTTDAASQTADGNESIIRLSCKSYTAKTAIILHASSTNPQQLAGCGSDVTVISGSGGSFSRGILTQNGQTAGGGADLMQFIWRDFAIACSTNQNVQGITLGTTGNAIRSYTKNVIERVRVSDCRTGIGWYNTRLMDLNNLYIVVHGETTSTDAAILMDFDDNSQFNGDSDITGGQFSCAGGTSPSGGAGYGVRMKSEKSGSNIAGIRFHGSVFYNCNKMVYATWASTGTMGDHWFTGGVQCDACGNLADYSGSTGTKKASMLRFNDIYFVSGGNGQPTFRFVGGNTDEIVDVLVSNVRARGGGGCAGCRFIDAEFGANLTATGNQIISFEGTGSNPPQLINLFSWRKATITGNTVDADGISGAVDNFVTSAATSASNDITITGTNGRSAVSAIFSNANSAANVCVASNLPSAATGC